jgi:hypothetical protein
MCIDEAAEVGVIGCFTTDTSDLFRLEADELAGEELTREFEAAVEPADRKRLLEAYTDRRFALVHADRSVSELLLEADDVMRLELKFRESLRVTRRLYDLIAERITCPFGFEISLDETAAKTSPAEALFYLAEWTELGLPVQFFAPNIGFGKRADYTGDMEALRRHASELHAVADLYGARLSIHSGSGSTPESGKGPGTYEALVAATEGELKYKISGVYYELVLEMLAAEPAGSAARALYERIFDDVHIFTTEQSAAGRGLASPLLADQLAEYDAQLKSGEREPRDPRATFFRFYSWTAMNIRDDRGRRHHREALVELVRSDEALAAKITDETKALTLRLIDGLGFAS